ncbi:MAG: hypothetical protein ACTHLY_05790 [Pseudolabrys sp.]
MRYRGLVTASLLSIALYFMLFWGFDALRILTSPAYGLEAAWHSQVVYWVGRWLGFGPQGLLQLAAGYGIVKFAVAGVFAVHLLDRARCWRGGRPDMDVLEMALFLVVIVSIVTVAPAIWQHDPTLIRSCTMNLVFASLAAALVAIECNEQEKAAASVAEPGVIEMTEQDVVAAEPSTATVVTTKSGEGWYAPWR